jgi:hypothetical protein
MSWGSSKKKMMMIHVEQLKRTKDDGDVKVMSAQSVSNLIEIEVLIAIQMKCVGMTKKR